MDSVLSFQDETVCIVEESTGCCNTLKRIADDIKLCSSELSSDVCSVKLMDRNEHHTPEEKSYSSIERFCNATILMAQSILNLQKRQLPTVACIIGHILKSDKNTVLEETSSASQSHHKKNKKEKIKSGTPYIFFWDWGKSERPIPLLPLSKIDEGPTEALGYTVVSRGTENENCCYFFSFMLSPIT